MSGCANSETIHQINTDVNHYIKYTPDRVQYGVDDKWASPYETFLTGRGDCEDYVFLKREFLIRAGFDKEDLLITFGTTQEGAHMMLVVREQDRFIALDNRNDSVLLLSAVQDFKPLYWFTEAGAWLVSDFKHGKEINADKAISRYLSL